MVYAPIIIIVLFGEGLNVPTRVGSPLASSASLVISLNGYRL